MPLLTAVQAVTVKYNDKIKKWCSLLFDAFNLNHFWYTKIDKKGHFSYLGSHAPWCEYFAVEKLYLKPNLILHPDFVQNAVNLIKDPEEHSLQDVMSASKSRFDIRLYLSIVDKSNDFVEEFGFTSPSTNDDQISMMMNALPLLRLFAKKFKEENPFLMSKLTDNQIDISDLIGRDFYARPPRALESASKRALLQKLGISDQEKLTPRESGVIKLMLHGYSAGKIAPQIYLSKRTVEHHIERIKEKLGCASKAELIQKAKELELFGCLTYLEQTAWHKHVS